MLFRSDHSFSSAKAWIINITLLKVIVIVLGVLIITGIAIIGVTIVSRLHGPSQDQEEVNVADTVLLSAPHGSRIREIDAYKGLLFVSVETPQGDIVMVVDVESNQVIRRLELVDEP